MFHWRDGWMFSREEDGTVVVTQELWESGKTPVSTEYMRIPPEEWASIVSSVSKGDETANYWRALGLHKGDLGPRSVDTQFNAVIEALQS
jgi:hypothetical protein